MPIKDFQELAKDKPELLKEIEQVFEKADNAAKIQTANQDISRERDELKTRLNGLTTEKTTLETVKKDLETKLADAQKSGAQVDPAIVRAYDEKIAGLTKRLDETEAAKAKEVSERRATELKSSILSVAGNAIDADQLFTLMQAKQLVGINEKGESFYYKRNEKGENVALQPKEAVDAYLNSNLHLKKSSGNGGSGGNPNPTAATATGLMANPEAAL